METTSRPGWREGLLAALLCAAGAAAVFAPPLFFGRSTLSFDPAHPLYPAPWALPPSEPRPPINPITSDIDFLVLPGLMRFEQLEQAASSPWWDDRCLLGHPLGANLPFPIFLPTAWLTRGLDPVTRLDLLTAFATALAAFLAWRATRWLGGSGGAAALAAVAFPLSTWMISRWHLPQIAWTAAFWPGALTALEKLARGRRLAAVVEGAAWVALAFVSGFPQVGAMFVLALLFLALVDGRLRRRALLGSLAGAIGLGLLLAAPQLVALASVYGGSARVAPEARALLAAQSLAPGALLGAVVPELFGSPPDFAREDPPAATMAAWLPHRRLLSDDVQDNVVENALYPGMLVLLLAACAARRAAQPRARALLALSILALSATLLLPVLVAVVPGLDVFSSANGKRLLVLVAGSLPLLAALAWDDVRSGRIRVAWKAGPFLAAVLVSLAVWGLSEEDPQALRFGELLAPQLLRQGALLLAAVGVLALAVASRRGAGACAVALLLLDLLPRALAFNPFPPQREPFPPTESTRWLASRPGRVAVLGDELLLPGTLSALHGIRSLHGAAGALDRRTAELLACIEEALIDPRDPRVVGPLRGEESLTHPLLDLLEVTTVVHRDPEWAARSGQPNAFESPGEGLAARERSTAGPRAFLCGGAEIVPDRAERLARLARRDFPVHDTVLLETDPRLPLPAVGPMVPVHVSGRRPDALELFVSAPFDGIVVLTESWHAGWRATLDGNPVAPLVADHALLGFPVRAGEHLLRLRYDLPGRRLALGVCALACLLWLGLLLSAARAPPPRELPQDEE